MRFRDQGLPAWNLKKLILDKAKASLDDLRLINSMGWTKGAETPAETVREAKEIVVAACDSATPRRRGPEGEMRCTGGQLY